MRGMMQLGKLCEKLVFGW